MSYYRIELLEEIPHVDPPEVPPVARSEDKETQARLKYEHDELIARRKIEMARVKAERDTKVTIRKMQMKQREEGFAYAIIRNDNNRAVCLCDGMGEATHIAMLLGDRPLV